MISNDTYREFIKDNPFIKDTSKTAYITNMNTMIKYDMCGMTGSPRIHKLLMHPEKYSARLMANIPNDNTRLSYYITILAFLKYSNIKVEHKHIFRLWYTDFLIVRNTVKERENNQLPTDKQARTIEHVGSWQDILQAREKLATDAYASQEHLLFAMYTYVPPRRQMDYAQMRIYTSGTPTLNHNHFHVTSDNKYNTPYMFVSEYKTAKFFRPFFNKEIPEELPQIALASLTQRPRDYLFVPANGHGENHFESVNAYIQYSNRVFKKTLGTPGASVNLLRHMYSSHVSTLPGLTIGERQRIAIKMGHTLKKNFEYALLQQNPPAIMLDQNKSADDPRCFKKKDNKIFEIPCK